MSKDGPKQKGQADSGKGDRTRKPEATAPEDGSKQKHQADPGTHDKKQKNKAAASKDGHQQKGNTDPGKEANTQKAVATAPQDGHKQKSQAEITAKATASTKPRIAETTGSRKHEMSQRAQSLRSKRLKRRLAVMLGSVRVWMGVRYSLDSFGASVYTLL